MNVDIRRRRWAAVGWVGAVALLLAGALLGVLAFSGVLPAAGAASEGCVDGPRPDPLVPPADGVEAVVGWAAGASVWDREARAQNLSVAAYADGTVVRASNSGGTWSPFPDVTLGWAGPCQVAAAADRLRELAHAPVDVVGVTDAPTAFIQVLPFRTAPDSTLTVYAMDRFVDQFAPSTGPTVDVRRQIRAVVEGLRDAPGAEPWYPERYRLERFHDAYFPVRQPPAPWPGPRSIDETVGSDDCTEVGDRMIGADGVDQFRPPVSWWTEATGRQSLLGISVLFPGEPACPPRRPPSR